MRTPTFSKLRRRATVVLGLISLASCAAPVSPGLPSPERSPGNTDVEDVSDLERLETRIRADIEEHGLAYRDEVLQQYLDSVGGRMIAAGPAPATPIHFVALRDSSGNAFALSQGGVFVPVGLLARLDDEADLARLLARQIAHVHQHHPLIRFARARRRFVNARVADFVVDRLVARWVVRPLDERSSNPVPDLHLSPLFATTGARSGESYDPDLEQAAERETLGRVAAAGYDSREANRRAVDVDIYRSATHGAVCETLRIDLSQRRYRAVLALAARLREQRGEDASLTAYEDEAHRLMSADPEGAAREVAEERR